MKTQAEVDAELDRLERLIPDLVRDYPADEVLAAFAGEAERLQETAPLGLEAHVFGRINSMLLKAGLIPGDEAD